jgi:hypothetical protein
LLPPGVGFGDGLGAGAGDGTGVPLAIGSNVPVTRAPPLVVHWIDRVEPLRVNVLAVVDGVVAPSAVIVMVAICPLAVLRNLSTSPSSPLISAVPRNGLAAVFAGPPFVTVVLATQFARGL